jgi:cytochrome b561
MTYLLTFLAGVVSGIAVLPSGRKAIFALYVAAIAAFNTAQDAITALAARIKELFK